VPKFAGKPIDEAGSCQAAPDNTADECRGRNEAMVVVDSETCELGKVTAVNELPNELDRRLQMGEPPQ